MRKKIIYLVIALAQFGFAFFCVGNTRALAYDYAPVAIGLASDATSDGSGYIEIHKGDMLYANITMSQGDAQICDFTSTLTYDSTRLTLDSVIDYASDFDTIVENSATAGTVNYSARHIGGGCADINQSIRLYTVLFRVIGNEGEDGAVIIDSLTINSGQSPSSLDELGVFHIIFPIIDPPEVDPNTNTNYNINTNTNNTNSNSSSSSSTSSATTPQKGTKKTSYGGLPETGENISDLVKVPTLGSAEFGTGLDATATTCSKLTLSGTAEPNSKVYIFLEQNQMQYMADADSKGNWSIIIEEALTPASYKLTMYSKTKDEISRSGESNFIVDLPCKGRVVSNKTLESKPDGFMEKLLNSKWAWAVAALALVLIVLGVTYISGRRRKGV